MDGEQNGCPSVPTHDRRPSGGGRADPTIRSLPAEASAREPEYQRDQEQNQRDEEHDLRHPDRGPGDAAETQHGRDQRDDQQRDNQAQHGLTSLTPRPPSIPGGGKRSSADAAWPGIAGKSFGFPRMAMPVPPLRSHIPA